MIWYANAITLFANPVPPPPPLGKTKVSNFRQILSLVCICKQRAVSLHYWNSFLLFVLMHTSVWSWGDFGLRRFTVFVHITFLVRENRVTWHDITDSTLGFVIHSVISMEYFWMTECCIVLTVQISVPAAPQTIHLRIGQYVHVLWDVA